MTQLESLGNAIESDLVKIISIITDNSIEEKFVFFEKVMFEKLDNINDILMNKNPDLTSDLIDGLDNDKGSIYVFRINNCDEISDDFNEVLKRSKLNNNFENTDIDCNSKKTLYVGKSKVIKTRITDHFSNKDKSTPYSLKSNTKNRKNIINNKLYVIVLKDKYNNKSKIDIKNIIISSVESLLHERLLPVVGTSRT